MSSHWISFPGVQPAELKNRVIRFVRTFDVTDEQLRDCPPLELASECHYRLLVNGKEICRSHFRDTRTLQLFDSIHVENHLRPGKNTIGVEVLSPCEDNLFNAPALGRPALWLKWGSTLFSDHSWRAQVAPDFLPCQEFFSWQNGYREERDLNLMPEDETWGNAVGVENWEYAEELPPPAGKQLIPNPIPAPTMAELDDWELIRAWEMKPVETLPDERLCMYLERMVNGSTRSNIPAERLLRKEKSICLTPDPSGNHSCLALLLDFKVDELGYPEIDLNCSEKLTCSLAFGEAVVPELDNIRLQFKAPVYGLCDRYYLRPGNNLIGSQLQLRGGRYLLIVLQGVTRPVELRRMVYRDATYTFPWRASFTSSDETLNRIYRMCDTTLTQCTADLFMDCPWRERAFWVNDLVVENRMSLALYGALPLHRHAFQMLFSQQLEDGWVPGVCPAPRDTGYKWVLPATNLFIFEMLHDYWMESGDFDTVNRYLPNLARILTAVERERLPDGCVRAPENSWNFYDWGYCFRDIAFRNQIESMFNSLTIRALDIFAKFLNVAGRGNEAASFEKRRDELKAALWQRFANRETGLLEDEYAYYHDHPENRGTVGKISTELGQALALWADAVPAEKKPWFLKSIYGETLLCPELYLHFYVLRALMKEGTQKAEETALRRIRKYWGKVASTDSRTLYEQAVVKFGHSLQECGDTGSLCHGFGTSPVEFFQRVLLGVRPLKPGYAEFEVSPRLLDLESVEGDVPTPYGPIHVKARKLFKNGEYDTEIECLAPPECRRILR